MQSQWHPVSRNLSHSTELPFSSQNLVSLLYVGPAAALISSPRYKLLPYSALQIPYLRPSSALSRSPCTIFRELLELFLPVGWHEMHTKNYNYSRTILFFFPGPTSTSVQIRESPSNLVQGNGPETKGFCPPGLGNWQPSEFSYFMQDERSKKKHAYQGPSTKVHARGASRTWAGFCNAKICVVPPLPVGTCVDENPPSFPTPLSTRIKGTFPTIIVRIVLPHSDEEGGERCAMCSWALKLLLVQISFRQLLFFPSSSFGPSHGSLERVGFSNGSVFKQLLNVRIYQRITQTDRRAGDKDQPASSPKSGLSSKNHRNEWNRHGRSRREPLET